MIETATFPSSDLVEIKASMHLPDGQASKAATIVIGEQADSLAVEIAKQGMPSLAINPPIERAEKDLLAATGWMRQQFGPPSTLVALQKHCSVLGLVDERMLELACAVAVNPESGSLPTRVPLLALLEHSASVSFENQLAFDGSLDRAAKLLVAWAAGFVPDQMAVSDDLIFETDGYQVTVAERRTSKYAQTVRIRSKHTLLADEPASFGGADTGPAPYDLLLASLGACTSMTLRMYAERKDLPLDRVIVKLTHAKISAAEVAETETSEGVVDVIDREVVLFGNLSEAQTARMYEIADKCPVHRTLGAAVVFRNQN